MALHVADGARARELLAGRYRLDARIGVGGTAEVWRAHDERLDRDVAVKMLHRHLLPDDLSRQRFLTEARAVAALTHPGIVTIHDVIVDDDQVALVLELVEGRSLAELIADGGPVPAAAAAAIGAQIADALQAAHDRGLVHRDVKPANVLVSASGTALLVDFGIARALDAEQAGITSPGTVMGTLRYMAPEQLAGGDATPPTDVFGLGSVLYELLAGRPPFPGATPAGLLAEQQLGAPPIPGTDPELVDLVIRAVSASPERRPSSAAAFGEALAAWLQQRGIGARGWASVTAAGMAAGALAVAQPVGVAAEPPVGPAVTALTTVAAASPVATGSPAAPRPMLAPVRSVRPRRALALPAALAIAAALLVGVVGASLAGFGGRPAAAGVEATPSPTVKATPRATRSPAPTATPRPSAARAQPVVTGGDKNDEPKKDKGKDKRDDDKGKGKDKDKDKDD